MTNDERKALIAQGWTPPVPVDPDVAEAWDLVGWRGWSDNHELVLSALKRGRELERAEAKPKDKQRTYYVVWNKASNEGVVFDNINDARQCSSGIFGSVYSLLGSQFAKIYSDYNRTFEHVEIKAIITPPEGK